MQTCKTGEVRGSKRKDFRAELFGGYPWALTRGEPKPEGRKVLERARAAPLVFLFFLKWSPRVARVLVFFPALLIPSFGSMRKIPEGVTGGGGAAPLVNGLCAVRRSLFLNASECYPQLGADQYRKNIIGGYRMGYRLCVEMGTVYA